MKTFRSSHYLLFCLYNKRRVLFTLLLLVTVITFSFLSRVNLLVRQQNNGRSTLQQKPKKYTKWLMVAGDSNIRKTLMLFIGQMEVHSNVSAITYSKGSIDQHIKRMSPWSDKDIVVHYKNNTKVRVSFRFLHGASDEIPRLNNTWNDIRHCGVDCGHQCAWLDPYKQGEGVCRDGKWKEVCHNYMRKSVCGEKKPSQQTDDFYSDQIPDVLFYMHGLWSGFDILKLPRTNEACLQKLGFISSYLQSLQSSLRVVWLSVPYIEYHPVIKSDYLKWDAQCQKRLSEEKHIETFDLFSYVEKNPKERAGAGDYHVSDFTQQHLLQMMLEKLWL